MTTAEESEESMRHKILGTSVFLAILVVVGVFLTPSAHAAGMTVQESALSAHVADSPINSPISETSCGAANVLTIYTTQGNHCYQGIGILDISRSPIIDATIIDTGPYLGEFSYKKILSPDPQNKLGIGFTDITVFTPGHYLIPQSINNGEIPEIDFVNSYLPVPPAPFPASTPSSGQGTSNQGTLISPPFDCTGDDSDSIALMNNTPVGTTTISHCFKQNGTVDVKQVNHVCNGQNKKLVAADNYNNEPGWSIDLTIEIDSAATCLDVPTALGGIKTMDVSSVSISSLGSY
jgi:hypothetical protein